MTNEIRTENRPLRPAWVEVNLANLRHNLHEIQNQVGEDVTLYGVVKANAYGHGAVRVAQTLAEEGLTHFAVATLEEGLELRDAGIEGEILVLGLVPAEFAPEVMDRNLTVVLDSLGLASQFSEAAVAAGKKVNFFVALDTGMGRIGFLADDEKAPEQIKQMTTLPGLVLKGMLSHFSTADDQDPAYSDGQAAKYAEFVQKLEAIGVNLPVKTLANSAAICERPEDHYDAARPGIILYGYSPFAKAGRCPLKLKPVMTVKAKIVKIKTVPAGASIGYGRKFVAERPSLIATLPLGYADGYPRVISAKAKVSLAGQKVPLAGNICMDQCMLDITDVPEAKVGDEVIIMGDPKVYKGAMDAEKIGKAYGALHYEVICNFALRLPTVYIDE